MEDRVHVHVHRNPASGDVDWTFVAVYDGHGGPEASEYCRRHLLKNIRVRLGISMIFMLFCVKMITINGF